MLWRTLSSARLLLVDGSRTPFSWWVFCRG